MVCFFSKGTIFLPSPRVARSVLGSNWRCFLTPITRLDAPERKAPRKCSLMKNEAKMNKVRKAVTDYDINDQTKCKFFVYLRFHRVERREGRSSTTRFSSPNETDRKSVRELN